MLKRIDLSKRELFLIYILTILLIVFLYFNFIRNSELFIVNASSGENLVPIKDYELLKSVNSEYINKIEKLSQLENRMEEQHFNFGSRVDIKDLVEKNNLELMSMNISSINKEDHDGKNIFYINSDNHIKGSLKDIKNLIELISNESYLYIDNISINRESLDIFSMYIKLKEYTSLEIPYTGIVYKENNSSTVENKEDNLIDEIYGKNKNTVNSSEPVQNSTKTEAKKTQEASKTKKVLDKKHVSKIEESKSEEINIVLEEEDIDVNINDGVIIKEVIKEEKIEDQSIDYNIFDIKNNNIELPNIIEYILTSEFIEENSKELSNISNLDKFLQLDYNEDFELKINGNLDLTHTPIILEKPANRLYFEFDSAIDTRMTIYLLDSKYSLIPLDFIKKAEGYEAFIIELPKDIEYPLKIQSFNLFSMGDNNGKIKNLITLE